ncbi:hypothetical protein ASE36_03395 [Rhizobium sp. Root274]|nr:hypothetical protein ASC71_03395 [Rhizobium sp. Root1240]KRD32864.1 hypothetical protein ASE36_03395 [Rhizobium sp. Root274]
MIEGQRPNSAMARACDDKMADREHQPVVLSELFHGINSSVWFYLCSFDDVMQVSKRVGGIEFTRFD